eukprot:gnl/MRDRNA2_/MRDRNA2_63721_c0_seq1.p1 gnl/MRDRNA2_/MRDRNA2_63721_c0~~gnl/MRDRNA2_/MRDRNA2_63721_c0_seq1.p1  ORF type:complete len:476 (-),score=69.50 gnl/MRDRNA2_/MRDRNA2_63721_c0_seq1:87-1514(-)
MLGRSPVFSAPLLQEAVSRNTYCSSRVLSLLMILGFIMIVLQTQIQSMQIQESTVTMVSAVSSPWFGYAATQAVQRPQIGSTRMMDSFTAGVRRPLLAGSVWSVSAASSSTPVLARSTNFPVQVDPRDCQNVSGSFWEKEESMTRNHANLLHVLNGSASYRIRQFDPVNDQKALESICKHVYGGTDYLPSSAASLAKDPASLLVVLEDLSLRQPVAVANVRKIKPCMAWLEAVRTSAEHRGKGFAAHLTRYLIDHCVRDNHEVYTCTASSNKPMQRVFNKTGMTFLHQIHQLSFSKIRKLPGWSPEDQRPAEPLLKTLGLESRLHEKAGALQWSKVSSDKEFKLVMQKIKEAGGMGHLPGLWELLSESAATDSMVNGRMWKLEATDDNLVAAVLAFSKVPKIESLKSQWVCSLAATTPEALESAVWQAHSKACLSTLQGDVAFTLSMDGVVPSILRESLPLVDDPCVIYGTSCLK